MAAIRIGASGRTYRHWLPSDGSGNPVPLAIRGAFALRDRLTR